MNLDNKPTLWGNIFAHAIAFFFCIGFPAILTAIAPVSWLKYERHGDRVTAQAKTCLLFIIPYKTITVHPVIGFETRAKGDSFKVNRRQSTGRYDEHVQVEGQGFLVIQGPDQTAEVSITPVDLPSVLEKSNAFLKDLQSTELKLFVVANWKFSIFFGGLASSMLVLYLGGCVLALGQWLLRLVGIGRKVNE